MKVGMPLSYSGGFAETAEQLRRFEDVGLDIVLLPEAYTFDSVSQLGYLAAKTSTVTLCSAILNVYSRTPTLLAMTAAGLDYVSDGRFVLGVGSSGPQVVEGFHGMPFRKPLARTREVVEICRQVWRREKVDFHGATFDIPLTAEQGGSGLGKPLKLINHPVRESIPMQLAAMGPKNVELAAELFEAWEPIFYYPERADAAFGDALAAGAARRLPDLPPLEIAVDTRILVSEDSDLLATAERDVRAHLALYVGGMGARGQNFYNDLVTRFGFADEAATVQDLYLTGRKDEAAAALPQELVDGVSLVGPAARIAERVAALADAGVGTINATPIGPTSEHRLDSIRQLKAMASGVR